MAQVMRESGIDRKAIHDGLAKMKDVPSVIFGKATFDPTTRRVSGAKNVELVVKEGQFTVWDGRKPQRPDNAFDPRRSGAAPRRRG